MRLIDADWLQEKLAKEPMENRTYLRANEIVAEAPTAYDVDKIVERLEEKLKFIREQQRVDCIKHDGYWTPEQGMRSGMIKVYLDSLEIIKSVSIE